MDYLFSIILVLGMVAQACIVMRGRWQKGDRKKFWEIFITGIIVFILLLSFQISENNFDLETLLGAALVVPIFLFIILFRARLIPRMSPRSMIVLTIPILFVGYDVFNNIPILLMILTSLSAVALFGALTAFGKSYFMQVFSSAWLLLLMLVTGIIYFPDVTGESPSLVATFLAGFILFYLASVLTYLVGLISSSGRTFSDIRENMQLLAYAYIWREGDKNTNSFIAVFLFIVLTLNLFFEIVSDTNIVLFTLSIIPFIENLSQKEISVGDGVGINPDS